MALHHALSPDLMQVQEDARRLAKDFAARAAEHDQNRSAPLENYAKLRDAGFYSLVIPKEYGGQGLGFTGWLVAATELAKGCAATALAFNMHINATGAIMEHPDIPGSVKQWAADLAIRDGKLMCTSISEPTSSSHLAPTYVPSVVARKVPGGYRLYGKKAFASMWEASDLAFTYAHPEEEPDLGISLGLLMPTKGEGINVDDVWDTLGMRATRSQTVRFEGAFVPEEHVLHRTDGFINSFLVNGAAWSFGGYTGVYLGVGLAMVDFAKEYLTERVPKGFAQSMGYHPDARRRVSEMICDMEAAEASLWAAARAHESMGAIPPTFLAFLKAKYTVGEALARTARNAAVACGIHALFRNQALERLVRDGATAAIMPPNSDACASLIALLEMGLNPNEALPPIKPAQ